MSIFKIKYLFSSSFYVKDNRENTYSHIKLLSSNNVNLNVKWRYDGITSAGGNGNGKGNGLNKLSDPEIFVLMMIKLFILLTSKITVFFSQ